MKTSSFLSFVAGAVVIAGCSSTTVVHSEAPPVAAPAGDPAAGPAVCGDGVRQSAEACDDGNQVDADGCTNACALTPSSLHVHSFVFHSTSVAANGFQDTLDYTMPETPIAKLPLGGDDIQASLVSQTDDAFSFDISHTNLKGKGGVPELVAFRAEIPRKVGAFTLPVPKDRSWLYSSKSSGSEYSVVCHTETAEVLSESVDRRVLHLRLGGGCDWTRSSGGGVDTVKETLTTELTITLLPTGRTETATTGVPADPAVFGTSCTLGGSLGHTAAVANTKDCAQGWCAFDGRRELPRPDGTGTYDESYCTADCTTAACPNGWECVDSPDDHARICLKEVAVCGDSRQQPDEACDDGNKYERDGCSADCKKLRAGAQLVVQELSIDGTSYAETTFPHVPVSDESGGAEIDAVSDVSLRVRFAVFERAAATYEFEVAMPRAVGPVDIGATSPFYVGVSASSRRFAPTDATLEVIQVGADGRSLRAKFTAKIGSAPSSPVSGSFVVTLP